MSETTNMEDDGRLSELLRGDEDMTAYLHGNSARILSALGDKIRAAQLLPEHARPSREEIVRAVCVELMGNHPLPGTNKKGRP